VHKLEVSPGADRDLAKLKRRIQRHDFERLRTAMRGLADEPRPQGARKIRGMERAFRIRVGSYRVVYDDRQLVVVFKVDRRSEGTYRRG
jgi:mRNA interferase RelE/StbE